MSRLRKQRVRQFVSGVPASPGTPETMRCPTAPPGFYYTVVNGEYRLVSGYSPQPAVGGAVCPPVRLRWECAPNSFNVNITDCAWVLDIPLGGTRTC